MSSLRVRIAFLVTAAVLMGGWVMFGAQAKSVDEISGDIEQKEAEIEGVKNKIKQYEQRISQFEGQQQTLSNEISILENRVKKTELDIEQAEIAVDKVELEMERTRAEILRNEQEIAQGKEFIASVLRELYAYDEAGPLEILLANRSFSEFFDQVQYLETIQGDLAAQLEQVEVLQVQLETRQGQQEEQKNRLVDLREGLEKTRRQLESEQRAKDVLFSNASQSEDQFRALVRELREERQAIQSEVFRLQEEIDKRIAEGGEEAQELLGPTILSWPVVDPVITAIFHDPTYPFRRLFEHSGVDMAIPQGTPVRAAAAGYVAWARTARGYGNHVMIVHPNGVATLYAHMSRLDVVADQFVQRGEPIGLSGGTPGTPGAGFSTGPHLHFEVREDGIPVDPFLYLVDE